MRSVKKDKKTKKHSKTLINKTVKPIKQVSKAQIKKHTKKIIKKQPTKQNKLKQSKIHGGFLFSSKKKIDKKSKKQSKKQYYKKLVLLQKSIKDINIKEDLIDNNGSTLKKHVDDLHRILHPNMKYSTR